MLYRYILYAHNANEIKLKNIDFVVLNVVVAIVRKRTEKNEKKNTCNFT